MTVGGAPIRSQIGNWFDIRWCASLGVATGIARILPVVRAEAAHAIRPGTASARLAIGTLHHHRVDGQGGRIGPAKIGASTRSHSGVELF